MGTKGSKHPIKPVPPVVLSDGPVYIYVRVYDSNGVPCLVRERKNTLVQQKR